ncbi:MAG: response regulator, partial [Lentisphaerae bacterium]|nr:response regulator [Lentisphaerota bacterium]
MVVDSMDLADLQQRILIVEDELIVAEDLRAKLESLGYEVGGMAMSGEEALEMAEECRGALDLALMDIRLAGKMDGVETAGVMRERFDIPVIYLTAHSDTHTLERAKLTEPFGFLNKPLNARNLHSTVEMALYKHKIDRQLRISEERFRIMFETAQDGIFMKDEALRYTQVNPAIEELLNLPVEKIIGVTDRELLGPPAAAASEASEQRVLQGEVVEEDVTWGVDGTDRVLHVVRVPMRAGRDRVMGLCCIARDITERKLEEEERRRLARRLEKAQKQESLRMMAGGVAHDFNNLLQAIIGNADYVLEETPRTSHCYVDVENIKTTAVRAAELTKQMLDFSGTSPVAAEPLDASALVNEVSALLESAVGLHVDLRYSLAEGLPAVRGDINQLRQILLNLVINASEAFGDGSGEVAVQTGLTDADEADLQDLLLGDERSAGTYVFVEVADNGPGMDADTQGRAFDPFFSTKFTGRGLGLATVLGIVRGHGGAVDLKSEVGAGTVFRILLPATDDV